MTAVSYNPIKKGFAVDDLEVNLYFAINSNPLNVWRLSTVQKEKDIDGTITNTQSL